MKALLGSILVVLAVVIGLELWPGKAPVASAPDIRPPPPPAAVSSAVPPNLDEAWVTTILARPLFTPSRRPPAVAATAVTSPVERRPLPRLSGIVIDGKRRTAIFATPDQHRPVLVAEGGQIEGFRIEAIDANGVLLTGLGTRQLLRPSFDPTAVAPPLPAPPPPSPPPPVAFNGPPGLSAMPKPPATPPAAGPPGLPGLPSLSNLSGIPGLSLNQAPSR